MLNKYMLFVIKCVCLCLNKLDYRLAMKEKMMQYILSLPLILFLFIIKII
jgi:hypothetical protein